MNRIDRAIAILKSVAGRIEETRAEFSGTCGWDGHAELNIYQLATARRLLGDENEADPAGAHSTGAEALDPRKILATRIRELLARRIVDGLGMYLPDAESHRSAAQKIVAEILEAAWDAARI